MKKTLFIEVDEEIYSKYKNKVMSVYNKTNILMKHNQALFEKAMEEWLKSLKKMVP